MDKVAATIKTVSEGTRLAGAQLKTFDSTLQSLVGTGKTYEQALQQIAASQGVLSGAVRGTAAELLSQIRGTEQVTVATAKMTSGNVAAIAVMREMNGAIPTRAVASFATNVLGLGPILQAAFPIVGLIAMGAEVVHLANRFDPLTETLKKHDALINTLNADYEQLGKRLESLNIDIIRQKFGKAAGEKLAAFYSDLNAEADQRRITHIGEEIDKIRGKLADVQKGKYSLVGVGGLGGDLLIPGAGSILGGIDANSQTKALGIQISDLEAERENLQLKAKVDKKQSEDDLAKGDHAGESLASRRAKELVELQNQLAEAVAKELGPIDAINAKRDAKIALLRQENILTKENSTLNKEILATINQLAEVNIGNAQRPVLNRGIDSGRKLARETIAEQGRGENASLKLNEREFGPNIAKSSAEEEKDIRSTQQILDIFRNADRDSAKRQSDIQITGIKDTVDTQLAHINGSLGLNRKEKADQSQAVQVAGADADYQVRLQLAQQLYDLEHKRAGEEKDYRDQERAEYQALYDKQKEQFAAESEHAKAIEAAHKRDIDQTAQALEQQASKDRSLASELTGIALSPNSSRGFHDFAVNQARQLGTGIGGNLLGGSVGGILNGISGPLDAAGLKPLLKGTILDREKTTAQDKIEQHTKDSANWLKDIYVKISGQAASDPGSATPLGGGGPGLGLGSIPGLGTFGSDTGGFTGASTGPLGLLLKGIGLGGISRSTSLSNSGSGEGGPEGFGIPGSLNNSSGESGRLGASNYLGAAAGAFAAVQGFAKGGAGGVLQGIGGIAGGAAALDLEPISKGILASVALATSVIGGLIGQNPARRSNDIFNELGQAQFLAPTALNVSQTANGNYADFGARGELRQSSFSAVPTVAEPYGTTAVINGQRVYYGVPGGTIAPFSNQAAGSPGGSGGASGGLTINVAGDFQAMDAATFHDFVRRPVNSSAIAEGQADHLQSHDGRLSNQIRSVVGA
jgi:hypothetical protein